MIATFRTTARAKRRRHGRHARASAMALIGAVGSLIAGGTASAGTASTQHSKVHASNTYNITLLESTPGFFALPFQDAIATFAPKLHLNVHVVTVTGGGGLATEFEGGTGTIAVVGVDTPIRLAQQNAVSGGVSIIGTNMTHLIYAVASKRGSKYKTLNSLKGQSVAITGAGALSEVVLKWALSRYSTIGASGVNYVAIGSPPAILQAIVNGRVVAGTLFDPALSEGLASHEIQIVKDLRGVPYANNVFVARTSQVHANPTPYRLFMQAYNDAVHKLYSDPAYALQTAEKYWGQGTSTAIVKEELKFYLNTEWRGTSFTKPLYNASRKLLLQSNDIPAAHFPSYANLTRYVGGA